MNDGKMPENVLRRAVLGRIKEINNNVITGAAFGEDCAILNCKENIATAVGTATGFENCQYAIYRASNNLSASGFETIAISVSIVVPVETQESLIRETMETIVKVSTSINAQVIGGHTEASSAVSDLILTITAYGITGKDHILSKKNILPGDKIIATKWAALEGCSIIYNKSKEELTNRFKKDFVKVFDKYNEWLSVSEEAKIALDNGAIAMKDVSERGIFEALWELGSAANKGLKVDLKAIPIRQEAIEVCNYLNINPYALRSQGMLLIVAREVSDIVNALETAEIPYAIIGEFTDNNDRIVVNEDEIRHLDKIKQDEIYKVI